MGRAPCCDKSKVKRGPWSPAEDSTLQNYIQNNGHTNWRALPTLAGLLRCGKSCRLRWINYLRPDVKRGNFTPEEEQTIINLHNCIGNKWSKIASYLPGRTDNEIKNVWNTYIKKKLTKKVKIDGQKTEADDAKMDYSGMPSCTSSSITTDAKTNMEDTQPDKDTQESRIKRLDEKPEPGDEESKETATSSGSPISSCASNFTNNDDQKMEIPFESDTNFWEFLDSLDDPLKCSTTEQNNEIKDSDQVEFDSDFECSKWLRLLENELGLTSNCNYLSEEDNVIGDMYLEPETTPPALDYFPLWHGLL